jgi:hypothetical protein
MRPTEDELWWSVRETLRTVVVPALTDPWARAAAVQLVALADYARTRPDADPETDRAEELTAALDTLAGNPLVPAEGTAWARAGAALAAAVRRPGPDADAVRRALRPLLLAHLEADLAVTGPMMNGFRGKLPDA